MHKIFQSILVLVLGMSLFGIKVDAEEKVKPYHDPNIPTEISNQPFTTVNENGDIVKIDTTPSKEEPKIQPRSFSGVEAKSLSYGIMRLRCKPSANYVTEYVDIYGRSGYINGYYGGDALYLGTDSQGRAKFMMSGVIGYMTPTDVNGYRNYELYSVNNARSVSYYFSKNGELYHAVAKDVAQDNSYISNTRIGVAPSYLQPGAKYYSYDGNYFYSNLVDLANDINRNTHIHAVNGNNPYYSYYQYLPLRSKTSMSASELNQAIAQYSGNQGVMLNQGQAFINAQNNYGVNALTMLSHAALESAWGTSYYATNRNNLFGIAAYDSNTDAAKGFASPQDCINRYASHYMNETYLLPGSWAYTQGCYGDKNGGILMKWASDPYGGEKVGAVSYTLSKYFGGGKDLDKYLVAVKKDGTNLAVNNSANLQGTNLYQTGAPHNYPFIVLESNNNVMKVQTDAMLNANRSGILTSGKYDYNRNYGFINKKYFNFYGTPQEVCNNTSGNEPNVQGIIYSSYLDGTCFQNWRSNGETSGTTGEARGIQGIKIKLKNFQGSVSYQTHVSNVGWTSWQKDGKLSNDVGNGENVEAIKIKLENNDFYDILYRTHVSNIGWTNWVRNGEMSGTTGQAKKIEAIEIKLVKKPIKPAVVSYRGKQVDNQITALTNENFLNTNANLKGVNINVNSDYQGKLTYQIHSKKGWSKTTDSANWALADDPIDGLRINIHDELAKYYDVYYQVKLNDGRLLGWAKNNEVISTSGYDLFIRSINVKLLPKDEPLNTNTLKNANLKINYEINSTKAHNNKVVEASSGIKKLKLSLSDPLFNSQVEYSVKYLNKDWTNYVKADTLLTNSAPVEAIRIRLVGDLAKNYNINYRCKLSKDGWLGYAKNGQVSGSTLLNQYVSAININILPKTKKVNNTNYFKTKKVPANNIYYRAHSNSGWTPVEKNGIICDSNDQVLNGIKLNLSTEKLYYRSHIANVGWEEKFTSNQKVSGDLKNAIEAIEIKPSSKLLADYDIYYSVCTQKKGWLGWAKNGEIAGSVGKSDPILRFRVKLIKKGNVPPTNRNGSY